MDYCSSCRRHLNGALVCPGCGAYAPDIAPNVATRGRIAPAQATMAMPGTPVSAAAAWAFTPSDRWHDGRLHDDRPSDEAAVGAGMDEAPQTDPYDDFKAATPAPQGRAARRRQLARWKKNQRRAVVATAVALVGGGLTVAAMDRNSADQAQAATAPDIAGMGTAEDQATQQPGPSSTRPETQRTARTPVQSPAAGLTRRQSAAALPSTTPPNVRTDSAAVPRATATSAPQPRTTSPSSAETVSDRTATAPTQTPAPSATTGTSSGSSQASPAPAATSPSQICLLVVCLG